jgi:hypothetical protein
MAVFLVALGASGGVGIVALRLLGIPRTGRLERWLIGCAVGLGLLAYTVLAIGLAGVLRPATLWGLLALWTLVAVPGYMTLVGDRVKVAGEHTVVAPRERILAWTLCGYGGLLALLTLFGALAPPVDLDWDSLVYHLAAPKLYLLHHRIHFIDYDSHTNFPFTLEMLYTLGLATGGVGAAKLFHWATAWLTALAIALFTRTLVAGRAPTWVPPLAAVIFVSVPQVAWEATTGYIDLGTTLYQFLALIAVVYAVGGEALGVGRWALGGWDGSDGSVGSDPKAQGPTPNAPPPSPITHHPSPITHHPSSITHRWLLLAGLLSGWAMGTKMTAVVPFGLLTIWLAWLWLRSRERALLRGGALFVAAGVLVAAPWYVKSYLWTNNPVYPFFYNVFPHSINWNQAADEGYRAEQRSFGRGHDVLALLMVPWNVTMHGADFFNVVFKNARPDSAQHHAGDVLGGISATFLALLPLALFMRRWERPLTWLLIYSGLMVLVWFFLSQQTRYLLPVLAPLSVVVAVTVGWLPEPLLQRVAAAFLCVTFALHLEAIYPPLAPAAELALGRISRQEYLRTAQRDLYPALEFINTLPPDTRVAFFQEVRGLYCDRDYYWANPGQNMLIPYDHLRNGRALTEFLRQRLHTTHVLWNRAMSVGVENQLWYQLLQDAIARRALVPVYSTTSARTGAPLVVVYRIEDGGAS